MNPFFRCRHFGFKNFEMLIALLLSLTICGCSSLRVLSKFEKGTSIALDLVIGANMRLMNELNVCLLSKGASINDLKKKQMDILAVFVLDAKNSVISESRLERENDDSQSRVAIENCRKSATEKASAYFAEQVVKHDKMSTGFKGYKGKFYSDGTLRPAIHVVITDEPKGTENRVIFVTLSGSQNDSKL